MKTLKIFLLITILISIISNLKAQSIVWRHIIGDGDNEVGRYVIELKDKGYLMVGTKEISRPLSLALQTYLIKLDRFGNIEWQKIIGDSINSNECYAVSEDPDGNIYLPYGGLSSNAHLIKMNSTGTILWDKDYSSTSIAIFTGISFVNNYKNLMLVGLNEISTTLTSALTKLDSSGNLIWTKAYYDTLPSLSIYASYSNCYLFTDDFYFLCGNKSVNGFVIKTDTSGNRIWTKRYTQSQYILSIVQNSPNTFIATGGPRDSQTICIKFDQNGDTIWTKKYGSGGFGWSKIVKTFNNNYALGTCIGENFTRIGIIDSSGNVISVYPNIYPNNVLLSQENINATSDSGFVVTGDYAVFEEGLSQENIRTDALIYKVDKYGNMVSIKNNNVLTLENFEVNTFPNPFNLSFKLSFNLLRSSKVVVELYDVSGKKVKEIENKNLSLGNFQYLINTPELSSGIYFISFNIDDKVYSKKILLIK